MWMRKVLGSQCLTNSYINKQRKSPQVHSLTNLFRMQNNEDLLRHEPALNKLFNSTRLVSIIMQNEIDIIYNIFGLVISLWSLQCVLYCGSNSVPHYIQIHTYVQTQVIENRVIQNDVALPHRNPPTTTQCRMHIHSNVCMNIFNKKKIILQQHVIS